MEYFYALLMVCGGLGAFLMGVKILSDNTEKLANSKIKKLFNKTEKNKLVGVGVGVATTAIVQSSGLTTVMVVGLVNAGVMSLFQATAVIMGANIGTTITAQIAALQAFKFDQFAIAFTFIGMLMNMVSKKDKIKTIGYALAGLGLVFMGLFLMTDAMQIFKESAGVVKLLEMISNPFLLMLVGIVFTALVQSSSAITSILISMAGAGLVIGGGGNAVLFIILGTNIGSCVTAIMSSFGASLNAKRAAFIHLLFNVAGSLIFFIILMIFPMFMDVTFGSWFEHASTQIAMFHTAFNVICALIFLPMSKLFVRIATTVVRKREGDKEITTYLDKRFLSTPSLAIEALVRETIQMIDVSMETLDVSINGFLSKDDSKTPNVIQMINDVAKMSNEITDYLILASSKDASLSNEKAISALHHNNSDVARISELSDNITKYTKKSIAENLVFSDLVHVQLKAMHEKLNELANMTKEIMISHNKKKLVEIDKIEDTIDNMRRDLINGHIERMNNGTCRAESSSVFINLVSNLERIGDHLTYIAHSIEEL